MASPSDPPPSTSRHHRRRAVRGRLGLGVGLGVGATLLVQAALVGDPRPARAGGTLGREAFFAAVSTIIDRHVDPVDGEAAYARGLKAVVEGLDPHSHYLTRDERRDLRGRIGAGYDPGLSLHFARDPDGRDRRVEIAAVRPGSPAATEGLRPGELVLAIEDRAVSEMHSPAEATALLRGREGEAVRLLVQAPDRARPRLVELQRSASGDRRSVVGRLHPLGAVPGPGGRAGGGQVGPSVGIVELRRFERGTGAAVKRTLAELRRGAHGDLVGVVLDLRGNPGGEVDEALVVADLFVAEGVLTRTRGRGGSVLREERAHRVGTDETTPVVVLQDRHSASAAELLAAALQEHGRARVVGERSYGKGTVQEVIGLEDGSLLTLTTARYYSPRDRRIDGEGVAPDLPVLGSPDRALSAAVEALAPTDPVGRP